MSNFIVELRDQEENFFNMFAVPKFRRPGELSTLFVTAFSIMIVVSTRNGNSGRRQKCRSS